MIVDFYYNSTASTHNPAYIGKRRDSGEDPNLTGADAGKSRKVNAIADCVKADFPDCEILTGCGAHTRDVYGAFIYHTWGAPSAELAALLRTKDPTLPFYCGEYAVPYHGSFHHLNKWGTIRDKPEYSYWAENAARVMGEAAYACKSAEIGFIWTGVSNAVLSASCANDGIEPSVRHEFLSDLFQETLKDSLSRTVFHWRYDGISGLAPFEYAGRYLSSNRRPGRLDKPVQGDMTRRGAIEEHAEPDYHRAAFQTSGASRPNRVTATFKSVYDKVICRLVDGGADWYGNTHHGWSGGTFEKAFALVNDTADELKGRVKVVVRDEMGCPLSKTDFVLKVKAFGKIRQPFSVNLPVVGSRRDCTLSAVFETERGALFATSQNLEVFPRLARVSGRIQVYGGTKDFLVRVRQMGYETMSLGSFADVRPGVLVVAPGALDGREHAPDFSALAEQGVQSLILEQHRTASRELMKARSRRAFVHAPEHPVLAGFKDVDFTDWTGDYSIEPGYEKTQPSEQWCNWGNRDMVAANVFRRPAACNYLSLLVSGFDLYQTPLLEGRGVKGKWLGSQLEIGGRLGEDPVATTLFARMLAYLAESRLGGSRTVYFGGVKGLELLEKLKADYRTVDHVDGVQLKDVDTLIVADPDWQALEDQTLAIADFVRLGGRVLYLHLGNSWSGSWLPYAMELAYKDGQDKAVAYGPADQVWLNGWGSSDLYWRGRRRVPCWNVGVDAAQTTDPAVLAQVREGCGRYVFCSITPEFFGTWNAPAHKMSRVLSALMTSLGVRLGGRTSPYEVDLGRSIEIKQMLWEFAEDPQDVGTREKVHKGARGSLTWLNGQVTLEGERVRIGIPCERFLKHASAPVCWYRLEIDLSPVNMIEGFRLNLGNVGGSFEAYLNGEKVSEADRPDIRKTVKIRSGLLRKGVNTLVVRVSNCRPKNGGIYDAWATEFSNAFESRGFWPNPYPGDNWEYYYNPDWVRQY